MRHLILIMFALCSTLSYSQDPALFQTWYLNSVAVSDVDPIFVVSEINPEISPFLIITENLEFNGEGACNTFEGEFNEPFPEIIQTVSFIPTGNSCTPQIHINFESAYFSMLQAPDYYTLTPISGGFELIIYNLIFGQARFTNFRLNTDRFELQTLKVYPNPTRGIVTINANEIEISELKVFNALGALIKMSTNSKTIDITDAPSGIYFLKIAALSGTLTRKIIKK